MKVFRVILILALVSSCYDVQAQKRINQLKQNLQEKKVERNYPLPEIEFENIITGLSNGDVHQIARYFSKQIYLSLKSGEKGYYSNNQAFYLLENFFRISEPFSFQSTSRMTESISPYLSGKLFCRFKGSVEIYQVYLNLYWNGSRWEITQISIN